MLFRFAVLAVVVVACSAAQYGRRGKPRFSCSGQPVDDLVMNNEELRGRWYNKFFRQTVAPVDDGRPTNLTIDFVIQPGSNRGDEIVRGTSPNDGSCIEWRFLDFQYYKDIACFAESSTDTESCGIEEWVHYVFGERKNLMFFFACYDKKPTRYCQRYRARCFSRTPYVSKKDIKDCQAMWDKFNLGPLPAEDTGSGNNACVLEERRQRGYNPGSYV